MLDGALQVFAIGFLGGILAEFLVLYDLRQNKLEDWPQHLKSKLYWLISGTMASAGGGLACVYGIHQVQVFLAINVGASAPLIIRSFTKGISATPKID